MLEILEYIIGRLNNKGIDGLSFMKNMYGFRILEDDKFLKEVLNNIPVPKKGRVKVKNSNEQQNDVFAIKLDIYMHPIYEYVAFLRWKGV